MTGAKWATEAHQVGWARCFPISIERDARRGKWAKKPLIPGWQMLERTVPIEDATWSNADGYGILMAGGIYALDVDLHKGTAGRIRAWLEAHEVVPETRTHQTVSGGRHLLYRVPAAFGELRTRQNIVQGLDGRGGHIPPGGKATSRGFIAYGKGYAVLKDVPLATLSEKACAAIMARAPSDRTSSAVDYAYEPPADAEMEIKLRKAISNSPTVQARMRGVQGGLNQKDLSGSGMDWSLAHALAWQDLNAHEIAWVLLKRFEHGAAGRQETQWECVRQAMRCAVGAVDERHLGAKRKLELGRKAHTPPTAETALRAIERLRATR